MPPYLLFLETAINTLLSLVAAAIALFDPSLHQLPAYQRVSLRPAAYIRTSFAGPQDVTGLIAKLRAADPAARASAACELEKLGTGARTAIPALVERLADASPVDPKVCGEDRNYWKKDYEQQTSPGEEAAAALVAIGTSSLQPLVGAARAPQWVARRNAVWALGALDDERGVTPVLAALKDSEPPVRAIAAWALGALDAYDAVPALIEALKDSDAGVRSQVAWALGAIGDRRAVDGLVGALKDSAEGVRSQAAWALGALGDNRANFALAAALKDSSPKVRRQAAWALGAIGK
ncbi:MAG: HEAT repeat domain-containing protein [Vicinamibacterales bacterium]